ncbi:MAG TPA: bifunctional DNA-formamidopyrimidine glycosylase/DNA-(apurinic or apyrimidinic site) lyase [Acidobacteriota bacterium]|nr:bifunctional DNA-formamidopyrimidine glycosylase/DNA-(apurinic or apyrimidinic site) lyase [Acidobacteriota bacterium]
MPELPEVETIRRGLRPQVRGRVVGDVVISASRVLQNDPEDFARALKGQPVEEIRRRGKNLLFDFPRHCCLVHLGMTGQLTFRDPQRSDSQEFVRHETTGLQRARQHSPDRHTHLQFLFQDGTAMLYRDIRQFGKIFLYPRGSSELRSYLDGLGLEPFGEEYRLQAFAKGLRGRKVAVKSILLDQKFVAGVGNIYADEALFEARIHPLRPVSGLKNAEKESLFQAVPLVLERGLHFGGTSLRDYIDSEGRQGSNQEELKVYGRDGRPCRQCGTAIEKIVVSQRGTHFCPQCQGRYRPRKSRRKAKSAPRRAGGRAQH